MSKANAPKKKKRKLRKDNILIIILSLILIALLVSLGLMTKKALSSEKDEGSEKKVVEKLDSFDYYLTDHNTKYYTELFDDLKKTLNASEINDEDYATLVAKMFAADFYDLDSKLSKSDVGGIQFILPAYQSDFIKTATDSNGMYYYVKNNLYGDRKQDLPSVASVDVVSLKKLVYKYGLINDENGYQIDLKINYKKEMGYPKTVSLQLAHYEGKLYINEIK